MSDIWTLGPAEDDSTWPRVNIRTFIDGRSRLVLRGNTARWYHLDYAAPGRLDCAGPHECPAVGDHQPPREDPTYIEGIAWYPDFPDQPDRENRFCGCSSSIFTGVAPGLPGTVTDCRLETVAARGHVAVVSCAGDSIVLEFNDNDEWCGDWYEVNLLVRPSSTLDCSQAQAVPAVLWPPNHRLVPVTIAGITGSGEDPVAVRITGVTQDEPLASVADDRTCPDAVLRGGTAMLRAERSGSGDGRVYTISFIASDGRDSCAGSVEVCVPHDQASGSACARGTSPVNSLAACKGGSDNGRILRLRSMAPDGSRVTMEYSVAEESDVHAMVYDVSGRRVALLADARVAPGEHELVWTAAGVPNGVYFCRLRAGEAVATTTVILRR